MIMLISQKEASSRVARQQWLKHTTWFLFRTLKVYIERTLGQNRIPVDAPTPPQKILDTSTKLSNNVS